MSFLSIENLSLHFDEFHLHDVSFELQKGEYLTIIGPTGAGKTILLESLIGFWKPDEGRIYLEGRDLTHELPEKRRIGIVYQDYALLPHFTVFQNIAYGLKKKRNHHIEEKVTEMAATLNIEHLLHRKPERLSGGEQQRVALARALIVEPKLLLMDEPLSALDQQTRRDIRCLLRHLIQRREITVIHVTHDLDDVWALASHVAILGKGRLLQTGSLEEVFHRPQSDFIASFVGATMLQGTVQSRSNGISTISINGFSLLSADDAEPGADVNVVIRPENIVISKKKPLTASTQNVLPTTLEEILCEGKSSMLLLKIHDTCFDVFVGNNAVERFQLQQGDTLYAIITCSNVKIV